MGLILLVLVILLLVGAIPSWSYSRNWGYAPSGILGLLLVMLLRRARDSNGKPVISGLLVYSEGSFLQVVEGPD